MAGYIDKYFRLDSFRDFLLLRTYSSCHDHSGKLVGERADHPAVFARRHLGGAGRVDRGALGAKDNLKEVCQAATHTWVTDWFAQLLYGATRST